MKATVARLTARKDHPGFGIVKNEVHWCWHFHGGRIFRSPLHLPPTPSQLEPHPILSKALALFDTLPPPPLSALSFDPCIEIMYRLLVEYQSQLRRTPTPFRTPPVVAAYQHNFAEFGRSIVALRSLVAMYPALSPSVIESSFKAATPVFVPLPAKGRKP